MTADTAVRHATTGHVDGWHGLTMAELRAFVADNPHVDGDACLVAVTRHGTDRLHGVGFFSLG